MTASSDVDTDGWVTATAFTRHAWLQQRLDQTRALYGDAANRAVGTVWWYSASSVLVAPSVESAVGSGSTADPALDAVWVRIEPDGRMLEATSRRTFDGAAEALGTALRTALTPVIDSVAEISGARTPALWAIAGDSIANRTLGAGSAAGDAAGAAALAERIATGVGEVIPRPRFSEVAGRLVLRRSSCCLIDAFAGIDKCASCPNQPPHERDRRIRAALGA